MLAGLLRGAPQLAVASAFRAATMMALIMLVTAMRSPESASSLVLAVVITGPIFILGEFGLRVIVLSRRKGVPIELATALRVISAVGLTLVFGVVGLVVSGELGIALFLVALMKACDGITDIAAAALQLRGDASRVMHLQLVNLILTAGGVAGALFAGGSLAAALLASVVASAVTAALGAVWALPVGGSARSAHEVPALVALARLGLPLALSGLMGALYLNVPQYLVAVHGAAVDVVALNILLYVLFAAEIVLNGVSQALLRSLSEGRLDRRTRRRSTALIATGLSVVLGAGAAVAVWVMQALVLPLLGLDVDVALAEIALLALAVAAAPFAFTGAAVVSSAHRFKLGLAVNVIAASVTAVASWLLVPPHGLTGALLAILCGVLARGVGFFGLAMTWIPAHGEGAQTRQPR